MPRQSMANEQPIQTFENTLDKVKVHVRKVVAKFFGQFSFSKLLCYIACLETINFIVRYKIMSGPFLCQYGTDSS